MSRLTFLILAATVLALSPCVIAQHSIDQVPVYTDAEGYKVYDALFRFMDEQHHLHGRQLAILAETRKTTDIPLVDDCISKHTVELPADALADLKQQDAHAWRFTDRLPLPRKYELMPQIDESRVGLEGVVTASGEPFAGPDPDFVGYWRLSAVGFNGSHTKAVVLAFYGCGITCGFGGPFLLTKKDGVWQVEKWVCEIVS